MPEIGKGTHLGAVTQRISSVAVMSDVFSTHLSISPPSLPPLRDETPWDLPDVPSLEGHGRTGLRTGLPSLGAVPQATLQMQGAPCNPRKEPRAPRLQAPSRYGGVCGSGGRLGSSVHSAGPAVACGTRSLIHSFIHACIHPLTWAECLCWAQRPTRPSLYPQRYGQAKCPNYQNNLSQASPIMSYLLLKMHTSPCLHP